MASNFNEANKHNGFGEVSLVSGSENVLFFGDYLILSFESVLEIAEIFMVLHCCEVYHQFIQL